MSDSDDTDVLLLIPPNFFFVNDNFNDERHHHSQLPVYDKLPYNPAATPFMSAQSELESINARLAQIEREYPASSDISTISHCTVRSRNGHKHRQGVPFGSTSPCQFVHSTPKCEDNFKTYGNTNGILQEMDVFMNKQNQEYKYEPLGHEYRNSLGMAPAARLSDWEKQQPGDKDPLISLSNIWGKVDNAPHTILAEETLRRKHCERTIQELQAKLLEYQQKIAVAIEVDNKKDAALQKHLDENISLKTQVQKLSSDIQTLELRQLGHIQSLDSENSSLKSQKELLEKDVVAMRNLINDLEEKNQVLELKLAQFMRASNETTEVYRTQIADLEVRISNSHHSRGQLEEQLANFKSELIAAQAMANQAVKDNEMNSKRAELCEEEVKLLRQQKRDAMDKYRDEKCRADSLYNEKKMLDGSLQELKNKEVNVLKELDSQRISLKSYYQQQLEQVVSKKLTEFQAELDAVDAKLRNEAKEREKLLAERAIKQIEMINAKNEQEIGLLQEKHSEEVELYRIQLANATKTIDELQEKLDAFRSKRADIASKLHSIMESQWQKALEVLTSPNAGEKPNELNTYRINHQRVDGVELNTATNHENPENESFETPTSSRNRKMRDRRTEEHLQAYIQLLLNKSPRDLDNLEEFLQQTKPNNTTDHRHENEANKSRRDQKPPWK